MVVFVTAIVVVGAMVAVVSLVSGSKTTSNGLTSATGSSSVETSSTASTTGNSITSSSVAESSTVNTTSSILQSSASCTTAPWPNSTSISYQPVVDEIVQDPAFVTLTHGLCYSFALTDYGKVLNTAQWENFTNFVFDHYNGTIIYPCGTFPAKLTVSQIQVSAVLNGTTIEKIASMGLNNDTASLNEYMACPWGLTPPPVWVKS